MTAHLENRYRILPAVFEVIGHSDRSRWSMFAGLTDRIRGGSCKRVVHECNPRLNGEGRQRGEAACEVTRFCEERKF